MEQEARERLLRPLEREWQDGAQDRVVQGGLERLVERLGQPFPEVRTLLRGYRELDPQERRARLSRALELLKGSDPPSKLLVLDDPLPQKWKRLSALQLRSTRDLLHYYPRRYEDRRTLPGIRGLIEGQKATLAGRVLHKSLVHTPQKGIPLVQVRLVDRYGTPFNAVWFHQPWILKQIKEGSQLILSGRVELRRGPHLIVEYFEEAEAEGASLSIGRIVPVYPSKEGLSQHYIRRAVAELLEQGKIPDPLEAYREAEGLPELDWSLRQAHFPQSEAALTRALERLKFDEYLLLELKVLLQSGGSGLLGRAFPIQEAWIQEFLAHLPFPLTKAQERALQELVADMRSARQMGRLLQGDVGSGKTVLAAAALYFAARSGAQGALMAPTEILARQHYENLLRWLFPLGIRIDLLTGALSPGERKRALERLASGETQVAVGTHALIQERVEFRDLGLAIIDEEHRFGVLQRRALFKGRPDVLVMSATPIPRSLALTLYGDLEVSILDELPPGRKPVRTKVLPKALRRQAYRFAEQQIAAGHQVFVVAPQIEETEASELAAARQLADELAQLLPKARIGLLHGRMSSEDKEAAMEGFRQGAFDLLVSTTVIEVGVDTPKATLMIVENAERFGLAQLHQLRGRVGRGELEGYCILIAGEASRKTLERLRVVEESNDGFAIAQKDLELRGPGELRGIRQSGLPDLKLGDLASDTELIERCRRLAQRLLEEDPRLEAPQHALLKRELQARAEAIGFREVI
jgi:ATP-dependent DNA helicase RecG